MSTTVIIEDSRMKLVDDFNIRLSDYERMEDYLFCIDEVYKGFNLTLYRNSNDHVRFIHDLQIISLYFDKVGYIKREKATDRYTSPYSLTEDSNILDYYFVEYFDKCGFTEFTSMYPGPDPSSFDVIMRVYKRCQEYLINMHRLRVI